jgi:hypothetical protein
MVLFEVKYCKLDQVNRWEWGAQDSNFASLGVSFDQLSK